MRVLQEKNQISAPLKQEAGESWASVESAHDATPRQPFDFMPPGMDIANQNYSEQNSIPLELSGSSDVSGSVIQAKAMKEGYQRLDMKGTDDLYTGEHTDLFYGDAGGFCERNNYLDRS